MTDRNAIFRAEALEFHARGRDSTGGVVRLGARWIKWGYRITLVLVISAIASMWVIHVGEHTSGSAVVDGRTGAVAALLPAVAGPDLGNAQSFSVALPSRGGRPVRVSDLHAQLADDTAIRKAGLVPMTQAAILVTGRVNPGSLAAPAARHARLQTQMSVLLRSERLVSVLARQFSAMLNGGGQL